MLTLRFFILVDSIVSLSLIWVFAVYKGLHVDFVMRWLIYDFLTVSIVFRGQRTNEEDLQQKKKKHLGKQNILGMNEHIQQFLVKRIY